MVNLPLDGLLQLLANAKATGILSTHETLGDPETGRMVLRELCFREGMICGEHALGWVRYFLDKPELEWTWRKALCGNSIGNKRQNVEAVLLECARLADESVVRS